MTDTNSQYTEPPSRQEIIIAAQNTALREENAELKRQLVIHEENNKHNIEAFAALANSDKSMTERYLAGSELFRNAFWSYNHYLLGKIRESGNKELYSEVYNKLPTGWGALDRMRHDYYKDSMWESVREFCLVASQVASEATGTSVEEVQREINNRSFRITCDAPLERNSEFLAIRLANADERIATLESAQKWREIEKEKPPRREEKRYSERVIAAFRRPSGEWLCGTAQFDFAMGEFSEFPYTHWKPIGENPQEVSNGTG